MFYTCGQIRLRVSGHFRRVLRGQVSNGGSSACYARLICFARLLRAAQALRANVCTRKEGKLCFLYLFIKKNPTGGGFYAHGLGVVVGMTGSGMGHLGLLPLLSTGR